MPRPPSRSSNRVSISTVRENFNAIDTVIHYTRAAHRIGLWESERALLGRFLPGREARILEAGCGAGRIAVSLGAMGYRSITGFDIAPEMVEQAASLASERGVPAAFHVADATRLGGAHFPDGHFDAVLFLFNGLMQIPGRRGRRRALRVLRRVCRPGAVLIFSSHDRDDDRAEFKLWEEEARRWAGGMQDPRLHEFGDRFFRNDQGQHTFMHLPVRGEVLQDLAATGWTHEFDAMRRELAREPREVREFSDECRFWVAKKPQAMEGTKGT